MGVDVLDARSPAAERGGGGGRGREPGSRGGEGSGGPQGFAADTARVGLWAFMGTVTMLFLGFTSAYILRRASPDWQPLAAPGLLGVSTSALIASSVAIERARRRLRGWDLAGTRTWVGITGLLGLTFVLAQFGAWRQLAAAGVLLATNPHSSFFYVITGAHALHVLGGLCWFLVIVARLRRMALLPGEDGLGLFATYWHFLGGLWLYLLGLLFLY